MNRIEGFNGPANNSTNIVDTDELDNWIEKGCKGLSWNVVDQGIGSYEYWGARGTHHEYVAEPDDDDCETTIVLSHIIDVADVTSYVEGTPVKYETDEAVVKIGSGEHYIHLEFTLASLLVEPIIKEPGKIRFTATYHVQAL